MDTSTYGAAIAYVKASLAGAGAVAGVPCQIQSITPITGGNRVTFLWIDNNDEEHTDTMDVMNGEKGEQGDDYVLTEQDKADIAALVLSGLPEAENQEV